MIRLKRRQKLARKPPKAAPIRQRTPVDPNPQPLAR
jgi:hypothetical protein